MKSFQIFSAIAIAALATGCQSTTAKGPGNVRLTIMKPADQALRPGEINQVSIVVLREGFQSDVQLSFSGLPDGVVVLESDRRFTGNDIMLTYTLHASNDAPEVRKAPVLVTATGPDGLTATEKFHVTVLAAQAGMR
jgi:hypothetical protein